MTARLADLPRDQLLAVAYEYMLTGMLSNQSTLPQTIVAGGTLDDLNQVAIDVWMGASPIYTHRMRTLMGIEGDDVPAIMKALQLDVGFVHQYMAVHYQVNDPYDGEFWLDHCGALLNVEPFGEERVVGMCHTIEDPTFDATAYATNPRARIRPIHRPPRVPSDRTPHCHWTIIIDPENEPVGPARLTQHIGALPLGQLPVEPRPAREGYWGAFDPKFGLADTSDATLIALANEFAMQTHLLMCSGEIALAEHFGVERAQHLIADAFLATAWVVSERLRDVLGDELDVATAARAASDDSAGVHASGHDRRRHRPLHAHSGDTRAARSRAGRLDRRAVAGRHARCRRHGDAGRPPCARSKRSKPPATRSRSPSGRTLADNDAREPDAVAFMRIGMLASWKFSL